MSTEHFDLGYTDYQLGNPYYSFQDPHLQREYDKGWEAAKAKHLRGLEAVHEMMDRDRDPYPQPVRKYKFVQKSSMPGQRFRIKDPNYDDD